MADKNYYEWLKDQGFKVSQDDYVSHRHFLKEVDPIHRALENLLQRNGGPYSFPASKFNKRDQEVLSQAIKILNAAMVPIALLSVEEDKPPPFILRGHNYDRTDKDE